MSIFTEAYKLYKEKKIKEEFQMKTRFVYKVKSYAVAIYRKGCAWFLQCGCHMGVSNSPQGLCKHSILTIVTHFLKENKLKLVKDE